MDAGDGLDSELESFRQQWLSDLRRGRPQEDGTQADVSVAERTATAAALRQPGGPSRPAQPKKPAQLDDDDDYVQPRSFDGPAVAPAPPTSSVDGQVQPTGYARPAEPVSALDHYEEAVEKEALGSLGDSLKLYRQAFRMDARVDQLYRKKHFPQKTTQSARPASSQAHTQPPESQPQSVKELIAGFSGLSIDPAPPAVEGTPAPPCPIAGLPDEIVTHVLNDVAVDNVAEFVRLSLVCKKLAYLVATEEQIWRRADMCP